MIEKDVKADVKKRIKKAAPNAHVFCPVQSGFGAPDLDFIVTLNGFSLRIETKVDHKKPSPRQRLTIDAVVKAGGVVLVIDQVNIDDLDVVLSYLLRGQQGAALQFAAESRAQYDKKR